MALEPLFLNYCFDKNRLKSLITWSLLAAGEMQTIQIVENLKQIGFQFAAKAGISLSLDDLKVPPEKLPLVSQATQQAEETQQEYQRGNLTKIELKASCCK
jgi:DNA-directed RNA polymerase subunit beta'